MARSKDTGGKHEKPGTDNGTRINLEAGLDELFQLPLAEFTAARNALAARFKQAGRGDEAQRVKALVKPSISAWAVNQLYWRHRDAFDRLIAAGERFRRAQASQFAGQAADMHGPLALRREVLSNLTRQAGALLRDAGHNPAPDTMRRIGTTLEALSAYSSFSDAAPPGRLTDDVDPPGFEALTGLIPSAGQTERPVQPARVVPFQPAARAAASKREERQTRIAAAKAALQAAELALHETRTAAHNAAAVLKKASAHSNETEKNRREAEERFTKATAAAEEARRQLQDVTADAEKASKALEEAERGVEKARKELGHSET